MLGSWRKLRRPTRHEYMTSFTRPAGEVTRELPPSIAGSSPLALSTKSRSLSGPDTRGHRRQIHGFYVIIDLWQISRKIFGRAVERVSRVGLCRSCPEGPMQGGVVRSSHPGRFPLVSLSSGPATLAV